MFSSHVTSAVQHSWHQVPHKRRFGDMDLQCLCPSVKALSAVKGRLGTTQTSNSAITLANNFMHIHNPSEPVGIRAWNICRITAVLCTVNLLRKNDNQYNLISGDSICVCLSNYL